MYAVFHIYEDGHQVPLSHYTMNELDLLNSAISKLTDGYDIDMNRGCIYDINNIFYDKFHDPDKVHKIYPRIGWGGVNLEVSFDIVFGNEYNDTYISEEDDNDSYS